ncbi:bifunctional riboflavin kinase/FAD synthetase [Paenibacillus tarimensis]|uniref:bifunctional riboflavin kinase/FAD synthetase n=1 Tax=Paenibacillus tarimensis TaxID=416012 RepID=UPI001F0327C9|nr:bifunctional riboflavin kinase/FAD synthetase [Paenibacillus tarimensis]MCF2942354.1 bifunctional riboflavin kinase/FAD synthetase [Paenibacillus tarimensis]
MEIIRLRYPFDSHSLVHASQGKVMAVGHFDGVHLGHQDVIYRAVRQAAETGRLAAVMTFHPHPKEVLGHGRQYASALTPMEEKLQLFASIGVDLAYVVHFDETLAALSPEQFVQELLRELRVEEAVVGFDFTFGSRGAGTPETLQKLGGRDLSVTVIPPFVDQGIKVSSSRIREALLAGEVTAAKRLLGRPYRISGIVTHGEGRGRMIGFPTANIAQDAYYTLPKLGVYAVTAVLEDGSACPAVMNLGVKPTFHDVPGEAKLEVHLFDYSGDLYGQRLAVDFESFLRPERKFSGVEQLVHQIKQDAEEARTILAGLQPGSITENGC